MPTSSATPAASSRTTALRSLVVSHYLLGTEGIHGHQPYRLRPDAHYRTRSSHQNPETALGPRPSPPPSSMPSRTSKRMSATNCRSSAPIPGFPSPSPSAGSSTTSPAASYAKSSTPDRSLPGYQASDGRKSDGHQDGIQKSRGWRFGRSRPKYS